LDYASSSLAGEAIFNFHVAVSTDIEQVSSNVHDAWIKTKLSQGVTSRKSESGEELMVPYEQLSEAAKDLDRNTVKTVYAAIVAA
jgi:hypothetical protein